MIDLMKLYGKKYKVTMDESWDAENPDNRTEWKANGEIAWYYEIRGRRGMIYLQKENACALECTEKVWGNMRKKYGLVLERLRGCDEGPTLLVKESELDTIVKAIGPRKRKVLSPEQKQIQIERLRKWTFQKRSAGQS